MRERGPKPSWDGARFVLGSERAAVLAYDVGASGWSDELTLLHEAVSVDGSHFIDKASRADALCELARVLPPGPCTVIEIGCSSGYFLSEVKREIPRATLVGADYTLGTLHQLARRIDGVALVRFDLARCPLPSAVFDAAVLLNVLEHIEDDAGAVAQLHRIVKPGGAVIVEVPAAPHLYDAYDRELRHFRRYTLEGLCRLFEQAGFVVERRNHLAALLYPAFWLAKKRSIARGAGRGGAGHVARQVVRTSRFNILGDAVMMAEAMLRRVVVFPAGIRCVITARKRGP